MVASVYIADRRVGAGSPCFIISEAGVNHNGDIRLAKRLVDAAVASASDAVKFQTFRAEKLAAPVAHKAPYQERATGGGQSQLQMLRKLELSDETFRELSAYCSHRGILFLSTPFDEESADFLDKLGVPAFKLPSGELTHLSFLAHVARKKKPLIISTGMSSLEEVEAAVKSVRAEGNNQLILLHCVSNYPAQAREANLRTMQTLADRFKVPVGFSDHTEGSEVSWAAVALGASVIEKHLTIKKTFPGPDHRASLEPDEFASLTAGIRKVESALGHGRKEPAESEKETARAARRSLVAARDIPTGAMLTKELIAIKRPGTGLSPLHIAEYIGRRAAVAIPEGTLLKNEMLI